MKAYRAQTNRISFGVKLMYKRIYVRNFKVRKIKMSGGSRVFDLFVI